MTGEQSVLDFRVGKVEYRGPWQQPFRATNVLCSDGKRRSAFRLRTPDTFFSMPASIKIKGKTVSGYLTKSSDGTDVEFHSYLYGKNGHLLP